MNTIHRQLGHTKSTDLHRINQKTIQSLKKLKKPIQPDAQTLRESFS